VHEERRILHAVAGFLGDPAIAIEELLRASKGSLMQLLGGLNQAEARTKFAVKRSRVIPHHFEPPPFRRTFWAKRAHDDVAAGLDAACNLPDVSSPLLGRSKKMEYCPIMPNVVYTLLQLDFSDIADVTALLRVSLAERDGFEPPIQVLARITV
jgi:hypothetical protein